MALPGAIAVPPEVVVFGCITGLAYGLIAVGLVLTFRASGVINLAHGQVGALAAAVLAVMVQRWEIPYWLALGAAIVVGGALGAVVEVGVVRRLRSAPTLLTLVATLGVAQVLLFGSAAIASELPAGELFPQPSGLPSTDLGALTLTPAYWATLALAPLAVAGLVAVLRLGSLGLALRATWSNADGASLLGVPARRLSAATWAIAGSLAALTAALSLPAGGSPELPALGPALLVRALAAAVIARMSSFPVALAAGIGVGMIEQVALWNSSDPRLADVLLLGVIVVVLLLRPAVDGRRPREGSWVAIARWLPLPALARGSARVRWANRVPVGLALIAAALSPAVLSPEDTVALAVVASFALVGLSLWLVAGLSGQLSLGQFAFAGVGAACAARVGDATGAPELGLAAAAAAGALAAALVALPALRGGATMLAVTTLAFALAAEGWLLERSWALGTDGLRPDGIELLAGGTTGRFLLALAVLAAATAAVTRLAGGAFGRRLVAVRDNEDAARAFGVGPFGARLRAVAVGGALAGVGGAVLAQTLFTVGPSAFPVSASFDAVAMAALGGLGFVGGPLLGALYIAGLPQLAELSTVQLAASSLGWLAVVLLVPGGLAGVLSPVRRRWVERLAGTAPGSDAPRAESQAAHPRVESLVEAAGLGQVAAPKKGSPALALADTVRHFGGVRAVDGVSIALGSGEAVGLTGPNGAGKSTVVDLASGARRPTAGRVFLFGEDVTGLSADARARRGLARSYQSAALFPTMTTLEAATLACEQAARGTARSAASKRARELVALMGLDRHAERPLYGLSAGTRRIAELTCMLALDPRVLLLDEPTAGLAQREAEALAGLLLRVHEELSVALLVVGHDVALLAAVAPRIVVMEEGRIAFDGAVADLPALAYFTVGALR